MFAHQLDTQTYLTAGVLQDDTLAPYLFIIGLDYVLGTLIDLIKENCFTLKRSEVDDNPHKVLMMCTALMR